MKDADFTSSWPGNFFVNCWIWAIRRSKSEVSCSLDNMTVCVLILLKGSTIFKRSRSTEASKHWKKEYQIRMIKMARWYYNVDKRSCPLEIKSFVTFHFPKSAFTWCQSVCDQTPLIFLKYFLSRMKLKHFPVTQHTSHNLKCTESVSVEHLLLGLQLKFSLKC